MRSRYGLYDTTRGLTTAVAAGVAGLLLWVATQVGQTSAGRFWAEMGIVAGAGLVLALAHVVVGWMKGLRTTFSAGTFLLGFLPVLICVGWILMATQPGHGWYEGDITAWSKNVGLMGLLHDLGLWHGVLAFGFGLVLGHCFDHVPLAERVAEREDVAAGARERRFDDERHGPTWRQRPTAGTAPADEPTTAERREAAAAEPHTVTVGPGGERERDRVPERMD